MDQLILFVAILEVIGLGGIAWFSTVLLNEGRLARTKVISDLRLEEHIRRVESLEEELGLIETRMIRRRQEMNQLLGELSKCRHDVEAQLAAERQRQDAAGARVQAPAPHPEDSEK